MLQGSRYRKQEEVYDYELKHFLHR